MMSGKMILAGAVALLLAPAMVMAQNDSSQGGIAGAAGAKLSNAANGKVGTVHGHANNPIGAPYVKTNVFATTNGSPQDAAATAVTDNNGDYSMKVPEGKYQFVLQEPNPKDPKKEIDDSGAMLVSVVEKGDVVVNFDGTREEYVSKLTPEMRKQVADLKEKNAAILADQAKVKNLNALLIEERADRKAGNIDQATQLATQITQGKPAEPIGWFELGADEIAAKKYSEAIPNLQKAEELAKSATKPNTEVEGAALQDLGEAYANTKQLPQAAQAYEQAAKIDPPGAYTYYVNEAILELRLLNVDEAAAAANNAITADPTKPLAYYLKGQALIQKAGADSAGKITVPPGCVEAYQKYLTLAPDGEHAEEVSGILQGIGATVPNSYHAKKK
jgi:tetratricopeptide (TPR) repeat protein